MLRRGLEHGFIDRSVMSTDQFQPQLITNDPQKGEKVITTLKQEMENCDEFMFSVAFVNSGGVNALLQEFKVLTKKGIKGRIIASQYQNFTQPAALKKLISMKNIEVRVITEKVSNMHSKCYIFRHGDSYDVIIGSSNLTNSALCENMEWNLKFNSKSSGDIIHSILSEFEKDFELATPIDDNWITGYAEIYDDERRFRLSLKQHNPKLPGNTNRIQPNFMQKEALAGLRKVREAGEDRALVISATGSGKTFLSAFDAKIASKKFLYIVHRLPILDKSMESYERVMEGTKTIAKYDPVKNNLDADCTFVTIQTLSKDEVLANIPKDTFDYILIDEVHHVGAQTYQKVLNHFKPKFLLGMTATPDRTDGYDVYKLFNYNIAYDIRLKEAMEYKLICPFHYFGIADLAFDDVSEEDKTKFLKARLDERIEHIISNAEYYGFCGDRVKGLVFCRNLDEAETYSREFNKRGYHTAWVSGYTPKDEVNTCIERLESDDNAANVLDYIFTADLFNEGVDIPAINQVIMLRPTESPIIFIQQLGRGLRHYAGKEYVVILDFIGNYERNYNIPLALSDDHSYNKSETRRFVATGDAMIPGNSTISFDEISRKKIYESIDRSDFTEARIINESYNNLKRRLGRIPRLIEFKSYGTVDALNLLSKYGSYYSFLKKKDDDYSGSLTEEQEKYLKQITKIAAAGKRLLEVEALDLICSGCSDLIERMKSNALDPERTNLIQVLDGSFYSNDIAFIEPVDGKYRVSKNMVEMLSNSDFADMVSQVIELGRSNWQDSYTETYDGSSLVLNMRYTYEDVCRLLNWPSNINAQNLGGYFYHEATKTFPVFINYVKGEDVVESQRYEDRFENRDTLIALSKSNERRTSKRMQIIANSASNGVKIHLFVRKSKEDKGSKEFYYLGTMNFVCFRDDNQPVMIEYALNESVRSDLYDYFNTEM